jgi:hypothetical protein
MDTIGAVFLRLKVRNSRTGATNHTAVQAYITDLTKKFYISQQTMEELKIIEKDFPSMQAAVSNNVSDISDVSNNETETDRAQCRCFKHMPAPKMPTELAFKQKLENMDKIKQ